MEGKYVSHLKPLDLAVLEHKHLFCSLLVLENVLLFIVLY